MKKFTSFILTLLVCLQVSAQSSLPEFSTEDAPIWYSVQFKTGGNYLSDGSGSNMVTVSSVSGDNQKFQFIGSQTSFTMKSKAGYWVTKSSDYFTTTSTASSAATLAIIEGSSDGYFEIQRTSNTSQALNQWGGTSTGVKLGEWSTGDTNNQLYFNLQSSIMPTFSSEDASDEHYYFIQFARNSQCWGLSLTDGEDLVRVYSINPIAGQLWKLVGTQDNFQIVSKTGVYVNVSSTSVSTTEGGTNTNPLRTSSSKEASGFSLTDNDGTFEIVANGKSGNNVCNLWGTPGNNNTIGFWVAGDSNNQIKFVDPDDVEYSDYVTSPISGYTPEHDLTLWYTEPATTAQLYSGGQGYSNWMEYSLPLGDGQFGASLFGGVAKDEIQFNEKSLWTGKSTDLTSGGSGYGIYQNFGSVYAKDLGDDFSYSTDGGPTDYYRQLDLTTATGKVSFKNKDGVTFTREYIASNPARVVAAHYTADADGKINLLFTMKSGSFSATTSYENGEGNFSGKLDLVSYNARFKVINTGGTLTTTDDGIEVRNANEVLVLLAGATNFDAYSTSYISNATQLASTVQARINDAANKSWSELYNEHLTDFQSFFGRVDFDINNSTNTMPTNELVDSYNNGKGSNASMLERLYFAYGRYLEISSSRGVDLPSNLQGIWNNMSNPAWNADIHSNINVQMNYWPAEPTNLSEMHLPFLNYIWNMAVNHSEWKTYAKTVGETRGWTCWTENNIFGGGTKFASTYVIANAWYCTHLWQHYRYTLDKDYLKKVFPAILSAAQFWMDRLELADDGTYEAPNEWSPEQGPTEDGVAHAQQIVYELFDNTLKAIDVLGDDAGITDDDLETLKDRFAKLDNGLHTETYTGNWGTSNLASNSTILREWKYSSYTSGENGHRHMSHLMCMYPFSQIYPGTSIFEAAVNSMKLRGDGATGWSMGWKINLWARALDGDHARTILTNALAHSAGGAGVCYNLFDMHPPFQIDGNFGACAGIAEMILQSNSDTIRVLPALPSAWKTGHMYGLKTVKDFTVDIDWENNAATGITIVNNQGQTIPVLYKNLKNAKIYINGAETSLDVDENGVAILSGEAGTTYIFDFDGKHKTAISNVKSDDIKVSVVGRTVNVEGKDVKNVRILDLQGRIVKTTPNTTFRINRGAGHSFIVEVTEGKGSTIAQKIVLE